MHEDLLHQSEENVNSNCFTWSRILKKISSLQYTYLKGITRRLRKDVQKKNNDLSETKIYEYRHKGKSTFRTPESIIGGEDWENL